MMHLAYMSFLVATLVVSATGQRECGQKDVTFVFDMSDSINSADSGNWDRIVTLAKNVVGDLIIGSDAVQVGAASFSWQGDVEWFLDDFATQQDVLDAMDRMVYDEGESRMAKGLTVAHSRILSRPRGDREDARNVVIVITDIDNDSANGRGTNSQSILSQADVIKGPAGGNAVLIVVAIGSGVDEDLLRGVASSDEYFIPLPDFQALEDVETASTIARTICLAGCIFLREADIGLVLDMSGSVGSSNWNRIVGMTKAIVSSFDIGLEKVRVGAVTYSRSVLVQWHLDQYSTQGELLDALDSINYEGGFTPLANALLLTSADLFNVDYGDREDVPNMAIVLTDQATFGEDEPIIQEAADTLKEESTMLMIAADINNDVFLRTLPSADNYYVKLTWTEMANTAFSSVKVLSAMCNGQS